MDNFIIGFIIGLVSSLAAGYIVNLTLNWDWDPRIKVRVFPPESSEASPKMYKHMERSFMHAKNEVYQYGEGFYTGKPEREDKARQYLHGIKDALKKNSNLNWYHIQTLDNEDSGWMKMQNELIEQFPDRYRFFGQNNKPGDHITTIHLIDPDTKHSKIFLMISKEINLGPDNINTAHTTVMIKGSKDLSSALKHRLVVLSKSDLIDKSKSNRN